MHVDVGGDFVKFVEAALRPFDETLIMSKGWQEDIKEAIKRRNTAQEERKGLANGPVENLANSET